MNWILSIVPGGRDTQKLDVDLAGPLLLEPMSQFDRVYNRGFPIDFPDVALERIIDNVLKNGPKCSNS